MSEYDYGWKIIFISINSELLRKFLPAASERQQYFLPVTFQKLPEIDR